MLVMEFNEIKEAFEKACTNKRGDMLSRLLSTIGVDITTKVEVKECKKSSESGVVSFTSPYISGEVRNYKNIYYYVSLSPHIPLSLHKPKEITVMIRKALPVMATISINPAFYLKFNLSKIMREMAKVMTEGRELKEKAKTFMKKLYIDTDIFDVEDVDISYEERKFEDIKGARIYVTRAGSDIAVISVYLPVRSKQGIPDVHINFINDRYVESTFKIKPFSYVDILPPYISRAIQSG